MPQYECQKAPTPSAAKKKDAGLHISRAGGPYGPHHLVEGGVLVQHAQPHAAQAARLHAVRGLFEKHDKVALWEQHLIWHVVSVWPNAARPVTMVGHGSKAPASTWDLRCRALPR